MSETRRCTCDPGPWPHEPDCPRAQPTPPAEGETAEGLSARAVAYMASDMAMTEPTEDQEQNWILGHLSTFAHREVSALTAAEGLSAERQITCPACDVAVHQVASASLDLALWQHWNWVCHARKRVADILPLSRVDPYNNAIRLDGLHRESDLTVSDTGD